MDKVTTNLRDSQAPFPTSGDTTTPTDSVDVSRQLHLLGEAAIRAPSGDNQQPWLVAISAAKREIALYLNPDADRSPMNIGQIMSRIALGAAAENVYRAAEFNRTEIGSGYSARESVVRCRLSHTAGNNYAMPPDIENRCTNRKEYRQTAVDEQALQRLRSVPATADDSNLHWITDRQALGEYCRIVEQADRMMFSHPGISRAFANTVQLERRPAAPSARGMPVAALEANWFDRIGLFMVRIMPAVIIALLRPGWLVARVSRRLIGSAAGLCVTARGGDSEENDISVGRTMQRAWLALTREGLAAQPMMSPFVMQTIARSNDSQLQDQVGRRRLARLCHRMAQWQRKWNVGDAAFVLRFGHADPPSARSTRPPLRRVLLRGSGKDGRGDATPAP